MKIGVLMGGNSDERDVSLASGAEIVEAFRAAGHEAVAFDTARGVLDREEEAAIREGGVGLTPPSDESLDLMGSGDTRALTEDPRVADADVLYLALHGGSGEDGTLQALLDLVGIPYTGSGMTGCALAMDKELTKRLLRDAGIRTPEWHVAPADALPTADEVAERVGLPMIVKAAHGGSSVRLTLAHDLHELERAVEEAAGFHDLVLFEAFVKGREFTVGILGEEGLPVGEIIPEHEIFDYECKYQTGMAQEIFPADLSGSVARRLQHLALEVHDLLRLRDFSRVDFMVDGEGEVWCLEANALPGMTANSLFPKAARAAGVSFPELCVRIAELALERSGAARRGA